MSLLVISDQSCDRQDVKKDWRDVFMKKFKLMKILMEPDFLVFGFSRALLEVCLNLMYDFFPLFVIQLPGVDKEAATWLRTCFIVSTLIGGFLYGFIIDKDLMRADQLTVLTNCLAGMAVGQALFLSTLGLSIYIRKSLADV